jgi:hypothetical protein
MGLLYCSNWAGFMNRSNDLAILLPGLLAFDLMRGETVDLLGV